MVKVISQALGGSDNKSDAIKVNDMKPNDAVNRLNEFFGA